MIDVTSMTDKALDKMAEAINIERRIRAVVKLVDKDCDCDRYTCIRCQSLQSLGYSDQRDGKAIERFRAR